MPTPNASIDLYNRYFVDNNYERLELFQLLADKYPISRVMYPGSFVHVTHSFIFPHVVYVDSDKQAKKFFADPAVHEWIAHRNPDALVNFHPADYTADFGESGQSFDLLISQYAGFVSQSCKRYLKIGGLLLANNSHGDASMASLDNSFVLVAVVTHRDNKFRLSENDLDSYFVPKSDKIAITQAYIEQIRRGVAYKKSANAYVFRRIK
jgi:hypothetical protein